MFDIDNGISLPLLYLIPQISTTAPTGIVTGTVTATGTVSHPTVTYSSTNPCLATRRTRFTGSSTGGNAAGLRTTGLVSHGTGSTSAGFHGSITFSTSGQLSTLGASAFVGVCASTAVLAGDPSALTNAIGIGYEAADALTSNWSFFYNAGSGTATKVTITNMPRATSDRQYRVGFRAMTGTDIQVVVRDLTRGFTLLNTVVTVADSKFPSVDTLLALKAEVYNGAVAEAALIDVHQVVLSARG